MNCPICGKPYESMKRNKFGGAEYHHAGDPLNVFCQQSSASYKAAEQSAQADGACTCANRHIGEDHICVNCGGVA